MTVKEFWEKFEGWSDLWTGYALRGVFVLAVFFALKYADDIAHALLPRLF